MRSFLLICCAALACAATDPKSKVEDYEVHARVGSVAIGADYMVYSFSGEGQTFVLDDFLVVEVALFPPKGDTIAAASADFTLRIDGKRVIAAAPPQMGVNSMQRRQWQQSRGVQATGGMGDKVVIVGGPPRQTPPYGQEPRRTPAPP